MNYLPLFLKYDPKIVCTFVQRQGIKILYSKTSWLMSCVHNVVYNYCYCFDNLDGGDAKNNTF